MIFERIVFYYHPQYTTYFPLATKTYPLPLSILYCRGSTKQTHILTHPGHQDQPKTHYPKGIPLRVNDVFIQASFMQTHPSLDFPMSP